MKLLTGFPTEQDCMDKSAALHAALGPPPDAETRYLVGWKQHPDTGAWALCVAADYESLLPQSDRDALVPDDWPLPPA